MKRVLITLSAVLALASCQKDQTLNYTNSETDKNEVLYAEIEQSETKTSLSGVKTLWSDNDQFKVFDNTGKSAIYKYSASNESFTQESAEAGFSIDAFAAAYYPAENVSGYNKDSKVLSISFPATQAYAEGTFASNVAPMASNVIKTEGGKKTVNFKNAFAVVKIPVKYTANHEHFSPKVDYISLTSATTKLNGNFQITLSDENTVTVGAGTGTNTITLENCNDADVMGETAKDFYIVVPELQDNEKIYVYVNNGVTKRAATTANKTEGETKNILKQNSILTMPVLTIFDDGTVNGQFSVSATQKVYLSQGNLQYRANPADWRFAPSQTAVVGNGNSTRTASNPNYIDLFCYGASGYNGYTPYGDNMVSVQIANTEYDWGVHNAISNGGNTAGLWRTLTLAEWDYLFSRNHGFAYATVNGTLGIIILPDGSTISLTWPTKTTDSTKPGEWTGNISANNISGDDWAKYESAGCVFLPVAGLRTSSGLSYSNSSFNSNYWTSTKSDCEWPKDQKKGNVARYFYMCPPNYFRTGESNGAGYPYAFAVRLARNI